LFLLILFNAAVESRALATSLVDNGVTQSSADQSTGDKDPSEHQWSCSHSAREDCSRRDEKCCPSSL